MRKEHGYTLMELLVVVALLAILAGAVFSLDSDSRSVAKVDTALREAEAAFLYAQTLGTGGRSFGPSNDPERFDKGFGIYVKSVSSPPAPYNDVITIYGGRGDGSHNNDDLWSNPNASGYETQALPGGVTITEIRVCNNGSNPCASGDHVNKAHILFRRGTLGAIIHDEDDDERYDKAEIDLTANGITRIIHVFKTGLIYST